MPKGEADGYLDTNAHLRARVAELEHDLAEQCRLLGMGSEREARLMAQLAESQARDANLRKALQLCIGTLEEDGREHTAWFAKRAIDLPADDTALRQMIEAARREESENAAAVCDALATRAGTAEECADAIRARSPQ